MTEKIGKITLDYSKYPGEDYYCDGEVEDELLEIVRTVKPSEYTRVIQERKKWPVLYHLSPLRENIVDWLPIEKKDKVLEVGSGCGAITGALARKAGEVTCVDLSKKRSTINAVRHQDCDNVTIHVGNFKDIEPTLSADYDYICLIGVFEYGQSYIGGKTPFEDFLQILLKHLKPEGRIVIAIENKYGLKYFAGCQEDHLGTYFSGIENYAAGGGVRTFGREGLQRIFENCGVTETSFYYPYPDYKFMTSIYSDAYLPGKGELNNNLRNFDRDRMLLFDEKNAFDGLIEEGLFPVFSNSYLAVLGKAPQVVYAKYSNDRAREYVIRTQIERREDGSALVKKLPLSNSAREHVEGMAVSYASLCRRYQGSRLRINPCELQETEAGVCAVFPFERGIALSELMDRCLEQDDVEGFHRYFAEFVERIDYNSQYPAADFDLVFSNVLVDGDDWTLIDYEWTFGKSIETKELAYRAVYCYLLENEKRKKLDVSRVLEYLGLTQEDAARYREQEMNFQQFVTGQLRSMAQLREDMGKRLSVPQKWIDMYQDSEQVNRVQIYEDMGQGFCEEQSYFMQNAYQGENRIECKALVDGRVKVLRIDPTFDSCMVKLTEVRWNGHPVNLREKKLLSVNGKVIWGKGAEYPSVCFATKDPNINLCVSRLHCQEKNELVVRMEIQRLPLSMAQDMAGAVKKLW